MNQYSFMQNNAEVGIERFLLTQSGTYQEQVLRPFTTQIRQDTISLLDSCTRGGKNIGVAAVQGIASEIIRPNAVPEGRVNIAEGWNSRRFRFMMHVVERHPFSVAETTHRLFFGFTDQCDVSFGKLLDPQMRIFFNSETTITETIQQTVNGPVRRAMVVGSNQIVSPIEYAGQQPGALYQRPHANLIRPEDVFAMGESKHITDSLQASGRYPGGIQHVIDARTMAGQGGEYQYSMRRDTSPTRYLADSLGAYQHAIKEQAMNQFPGEGVNMELVYGEAQALAANKQISSNVFLAMLKDHKGYMEKGYVTFQELADLFPQVTSPQITIPTMDTEQSVRKTVHANQSQHWGGSNEQTIAASLLAQVVPAIMMDNFIRQVSFSVTNGVGANMYRFDMGGQHSNNISMLVPGLDEVQYLTEFQRRMIVDALNTITRGNQIPFMISVFADLASETVINIQLGNEGHEQFIAPTFTDSLFSPIITNNDQALSTISNDLLYLLGNVIPNGHVAQTAENFMPQPAQPVYNPQSPTANQPMSDFGLL